MRGFVCRRALLFVKLMSLNAILTIMISLISLLHGCTSVPENNFDSLGDREDGGLECRVFDIYSSEFGKNYREELSQYSNLKFKLLYDEASKECRVCAYSESEIEKNVVLINMMYTHFCEIIDCLGKEKMVVEFYDEEGLAFRGDVRGEMIKSKMFVQKRYIEYFDSIDF